VVVKAFPTSNLRMEDMQPRTRSNAVHRIGPSGGTADLRAPALAWWLLVTSADSATTGQQTGTEQQKRGRLRNCSDVRRQIDRDDLPLDARQVRDVHQNPRSSSRDSARHPGS